MNPDIKKSFEKLKNPLELAHYAINTIFLIGAFFTIMSIGWLKTDSTPMVYAIWLFVLLTISDRLVHVLLEYD